MSLFKCKMCGGDLEIAEGVTIAECEYCGTKQTVPKAMDENLQNLFNRANTLRIKSEFDKAEKLYEKIIQADNTQSEAYWGLILCKYGIEYVDDPATFKKIPTCHRASYDSIIADDDYKSAVEYADISQRAIYEEQAKEIDRIQKDILALAQKEETYDVFICYKETDADGKRTQDSVIANDIYYQLTNEGFKVFYAAITLEGKLGSAYEPIIFAALNSAKVMLAIGTKPEYFNAVWVKNEWSRYLKVIKKDRSKLLIPCYRDMDAYELPEEFAHLQAQDMSKIGFINDVVRGIKKVVKANEPKPQTVIKETVVTSGGAPNVTPLLKRAFMSLEDREFDRADEFCEQVLNQDPENAQAYLGKLMAELHVKKQDRLKDQSEPFDDSNNYQKAVRFADEKLKATLIGYIEHINTRNENARMEGIYQRALSVMKMATTQESYLEAANLFTSLEYKDSTKLADQCFEKAEDARKDAILAAVKVAIVDGDLYDCEAVLPLLGSISGWRNADELAVACHKRIEELSAQAEAERIENERQAEIARKEAARVAKRNKKIATITTSIVCLIIASIIAVNTVIIPNGKYNDAIALMNAGKYYKAIDAFEELDGYKDSAAKIDQCETAILDAEYNDAIALMDAGRYYSAIDAFEELDGYKDSAAKIDQCETAIFDNKYNEAIALMNAGRYYKAIDAFEEIDGYKDSANKISECNYNNAIALMDAGNYKQAIAAFEALNGYKDSKGKIKQCNEIITESAKAYSHLKNCEVDDYIKFGSYEQDNNISNGKEDIEWLVLDKKGDQVLVISKYALDCKPYNTRYDEVTWETCTLRNWLNNDFINAAFSTAEKLLIPTVTVSADKNPDYSTNPGNATQDQVFLLSSTELSEYFGPYLSSRECEATDYAVANGGKYARKSCHWWIRLPGQEQTMAAHIIAFTNSTNTSGASVSTEYHAVRPAMWIDLNP